jgi:hypothetical protein
MAVQQFYPEMENGTHQTFSSSLDIERKIKELTRSVSEVSKYELLTTNQYLLQMELVLELFHEISEHLVNQ